MTAAKYSIWQALELVLRLAVRANEEVRLLATRSVAGPKGDPGSPGTPGEIGPEGKPGKLPLVRAWSEGVQYEGHVRTHAGGTWYAIRDTAQEPPGEDWICLAEPGQRGIDGRSPKVLGTYNPDSAYIDLSIVALNGVTFIAKKDDPGPCPGSGWQLMSAMAKKGDKGDRGEPGIKGNPGLPGPGLKSATVDPNTALVTMVNGDGSIITLDLYPVLDRLRQ